MLKTILCLIPCLLCSVILSILIGGPLCVFVCAVYECLCVPWPFWFKTFLRWSIGAQQATLSCDLVRCRRRRRRSHPAHGRARDLRSPLTLAIWASRRSEPTRPSRISKPTNRPGTLVSHSCVWQLVSFMMSPSDECARCPEEFRSTTGISCVLV